MSMLDALTQAGGPQAIARELGVDEQTAQSGMAALLPAILGGMQNNAGGAGGLGGLAGILGGLGGAGMMSNALATEPTDIDQGNNLLGQIFGSKDTSRAVADHASEQSGVPPSLLKKMLPIVAMLAAGYFMKQAQSHGGDPQAQTPGGILPDVNGADGAIGGGALGGGALGGGLGGILGSLLGGSGGGNVLNSILGSLTGAKR
ncbi:MAG: DUF937 domain-containing protein [Sphingomicrobium sp.]